MDHLDGLDGSNDTPSRNTTPLPYPNNHLNNTPRSNACMRFNDNGSGVRSNIANNFRSNTMDNDARSTFQTSYNTELTLSAPFCNMRNV